MICILTGNRTSTSINTIDNNGNVISTNIYVLGNYLQGSNFLDLDILSLIFNINSFLASYQRKLDIIKLQCRKLQKQIDHAKNTKKEISESDLKDQILLKQQEDFLTFNFTIIKEYYDYIILNELIPNLSLEEFKTKLGLLDYSDADLYNIILWSLNCRFIIRDNSNNDDIYDKIVTSEENKEFFVQQDTFNFIEKNSTVFLDSGINEINSNLFYFLFANKIKNNDISYNLFEVGLFENYDFYHDYHNNNSEISFLDYIISIFGK